MFQRKDMDRCWTTLKYFVAYKAYIHVQLSRTTMTSWQLYTVHIFTVYMWIFYWQEEWNCNTFNTYFLKNGKLRIQKKWVISNIVVTKKVRYAVGATYLFWSLNVLDLWRTEEENFSMCSCHWSWFHKLYTFNLFIRKRIGFTDIYTYTVLMQYRKYWEYEQCIHSW